MKLKRLNPTVCMVIAWIIMLAPTVIMFAQAFIDPQDPAYLISTNYTTGATKIRPFSMWCTGATIYFTFSLLFCLWFFEDKIFGVESLES